MKFLKSRLSLLLLTLFLFLSTAFTFLPLQANAAVLGNSKISYTSYSEVINDFQGVADYIHEYGVLPDNYITKEKAQALGWRPGDNLWDYAYGKSIGGDIFTNSEEVLPSASGRIWYECDINYNGGHRGADRLVYSNDGLIYGTSDHYNTFTQYY